MQKSLWWCVAYLGVRGVVRGRCEGWLRIAHNLCRPCSPLSDHYGTLVFVNLIQARAGRSARRATTTSAPFASTTATPPAAPATPAWGLYAGDRAAAGAPTWAPPATAVGTPRARAAAASGASAGPAAAADGECGLAISAALNFIRGACIQNH